MMMLMSADVLKHSKMEIVKVRTKDVPVKNGALDAPEVVAERSRVPDIDLTLRKFLII
jgi:hypothetical protein